MFGSLGFPELMLIFLVALIVFGPKRLPDIGRSLGNAMKEFKKATHDFKSTLEEEVRMNDHPQLSAPPSSVIVPEAPVAPTVSRES